MGLFRRGVIGLAGLVLGCAAENPGADPSSVPGAGGVMQSGGVPGVGGGSPSPGLGGSQAGGAPAAGGVGPGETGGAGLGGTFASGGAPAIGGAPVTGGTSAGGGDAGGANSGGAATGGQNAGPPSPFFPAPGSAEQCPDPSLRLRFDGPPSLGQTGSIRVYDAASPASPVAEIKMSTGTVSVTVGGASFQQSRPAFVRGNEAIFVLSKNLTRGHSYYVLLDEGVVVGPGNTAVEVTDSSEWVFSVAATAPATPSSLRISVDGSGDYCTLQGAIDAAPNGAHLQVAPGAYYGITYFKNKNQLTISGDDRDTTIVAGVNNNNLNPSTRGRALFGTEDVDQLTLENLTIINETPQDGSQAEALALLSCDQCIVRNSTIHSLQDTLLWSGRVYAEDSLIEGNVDYIWGTGTAYFNRVEIKTIGRKGYNVQSRNGAGQYGYVFVDSKLTADPGITGDYLARIDASAYPASHVAYINCEMGPHISSAGFLVSAGSTSGIRFWEYQSRAPGGALVNTSGRAAGSRQLSESEAAQMRDAGVVFGGWDPR